MIKTAIFVSKFEDGKEIASECKVNTETSEVFDVKILKIDFFGDCYEESVFVDNTEYSVRDVDGFLYMDK